MDRPSPHLQELRTVVGRRIVALFVLCALIPTVALAADSYLRVRGELQTEAWHRLDHATRAAGMSVLERLVAAETELELAGGLARPRPLAATALHWGLLRAVLVAGPRGPRSLFGPAFRPPTLSAAEAARVRGGQTTLIVDSSASPTAVYLARRSPEGGLLWGDVAPDSLLGIAAIYAGARATRHFCVVADGAELPGCESMPARLLRPAGPHGRAPTTAARGHVVLATAAGKLMAARWPLFLRPHFGAPSWEVIVATPESDGLAALAPFRRSFAQILLLALAVVVLLSHRQIRQSLRPLERLHAAALRLGRHDFGVRVGIESHDEFADVGTAFNLMADELGRQFAALDTINRIDRTVLTTLDWNRITDDLVGSLPTIMPADAVALLVRSAADASQARLEYAPAGLPDRKVVREVRLSPEQCERLERPGEAGEDAGGSTPSAEIAGGSPAGSLPALDEPLGELLGEVGSRLALPLGPADAGRGALVLASREADAFDEGDRVRARQLADQLTVVLRSVDLFTEREELLHGALLALGRAIDAKSSWTAGHSERVATLSVAVARQLGLDQADQQRVYRGGLLHDIGKIAVPRSLLDKASRPTPAERQILLSHVVVGERILEPIRAFADILPIVRQHHERYDGTGYPDGRSGEEIHVLARILSVADVFDAMVSARPYREAFSARAVRDALRRGAGTQFDPAAVEAFLEVMPLEPSSDGERTAARTPGSAADGSSGGAGA